jgi:hypothetical protein
MMGNASFSKCDANPRGLRWCRSNHGSELMEGAIAMVPA